jgi:hypothetical protein
MGRYDFFSWTIHSRRAHLLIRAGIVVLVASTIMVTSANMRAIRRKCKDDRFRYKRIIHVHCSRVRPDWDGRNRAGERKIQYASVRQLVYLKVFELSNRAISSYLRFAIYG